MYAPDLVLLDLLIPKLDGFHVCRRVREFSSVPILLLIARGKEQDRVHALDLGADGYLNKPFSVVELLARMRALLRRAQLTARARLAPYEEAATLRTTTTIGDLTVDYAQQRVTIRDREVTLSQREKRLLAAMAQNARRVVPQDTLLEYVWGKEYVGDNHLLQVTINRLRRKLEPDPSQPHYILTRFGIGYLLTGPI